jgi:hypothetical protein
MPAVTRVGGTMQWMAPELQDPSASGTLAPTASSDVYSLASVMYEVRHLPFCNDVHCLQLQSNQHVCRF